jgi:hypothetical protein
MDSLLTPSQPTESQTVGLMAESPFAGPGLLAERVSDAGADSLGKPPMPGLISPFAEALEGGGEEGAVAALVTELEDESFEDAVEALVDEAAALQLASGESEAPGGLMDAWSARLTADADRLLEHLEEAFAQRSPESVTGAEIDLAASRFLAEATSPAAEQFLGGLASKIKSGLNAVAGAGLGVLGRFTGLAQLTGIVRKLVGPLVRRVVATALGRIPASLRGPATALAQRLGVRLPATGGEIADEFDETVARALTATNEAGAERLLAEAEAAVTAPEVDPMEELDAARARLADDLANASPDQPPVVEVERFIPAVMAAMPLIRTAVSLVGRDRIKRMIAGPVATFIAPFVGSQAARSLAPHIADTGMRLLRLEHEDPARLGTEALVSAVEETVRQVMSLPQDSLDVDLRVSTEVQEAFAEAAARYLPAAVLRSDLEARAEAEDGGWVLMPRGGRPAYRFRAWTHPMRVLVARPSARSIVLTSDETLEEQLLEEGVTTWPVQAEVHLYEAVPGTRLGHLAAAEAESSTEISVDTGDLGELTPPVAGLLLGSPALGSRLPGSRATTSTTLRPGQRFFRVRLPGRVPTRRRVHRFALRLDLTGAQPILRVHLRVGERTAQQLVAQLEQHAPTQIVATFRRLMGQPAREALSRRLARLRGLTGSAGAGATARTSSPDPDNRIRMANTLVEAMLTALTKAFPAAGGDLARAAQDPASGLTLTFAIPFADRAALAAGTPGEPALVIRPGYHRD